MSKSHFKTELKNLSQLSNYIGKEIGISKWFEITQDDINLLFPLVSIPKGLKD